VSAGTSKASPGNNKRKFAIGALIVQLIIVGFPASVQAKSKAYTINKDDTMFDRFGDWLATVGKPGKEKNLIKKERRAKRKIKKARKRIQKQKKRIARQKRSSKRLCYNND